LRTAILSSLILSFLMCFIAVSHADLTSWVDKNGVRHYSNTTAPASNTTVKNSEEFKPKERGFGPRRKGDRRDGFSVLRMYEKEREEHLKEKKEEEKKAEIRRYNEAVKRSRNAAKRAEKKRQAQYCREAERKFDKLRSLGWRNYYYEKRELLSEDQKIEFDSQGNPRMRSLSARDEKAWKRKYDEAVRKQEAKVQRECSGR
jgi:hypothetical protein